MKIKNQFILLLTCFASIVATGQNNPCEGRGPTYSSLPGDTTITLKNGSMLTFNRCEFFDYRNCIEITEITDTADLRREGLDMRDRNGNILVSCGMFKVDFKNCPKTCLEVPARVLIRINFQNCTGSLNRLRPLLFLNNGNGWERSQNPGFKIIDTLGLKYVEFYMRCPSIFNCDVPKPGRKVKFKTANKDFALKEVTLKSNCPLFYAVHKSYEYKRKINARLFCINIEEMTARFVVQNKKTGELKTIDARKLSSLRKGKSYSSCYEKKTSFISRLFAGAKKKRGKLPKKYFVE